MIYRTNLFVPEQKPIFTRWWDKPEAIAATVMLSVVPVVGSLGILILSPNFWRWVIEQYRLELKCLMNPRIDAYERSLNV